jgi:NTE family protein
MDNHDEIERMRSKKIALVLSGGGARGAYQVGVISAIAQIMQESKASTKIDIYTGVSAGAINASFMATFSDDFVLGAKKLVDLWSSLTSDQVFYTDAVHLGKIGLQWMGGLSFGGLTGGATAPGRALLNTAPLGKLISKSCDFSRIERNIKNQHMRALAVTAIDYQNSNAVTFVQGDSDIPDWHKSRRMSEKTTIQMQHILASSAIPLLFPSVDVGPRHFGDGCVRNTHPCGPSIYMGAEKLIIIGVRSQEGLASEIPSGDLNTPPSVAKVMNVILNSVLLDGIDLDVERLKRVNDFVAKVPETSRSGLNYKPLEFAWICPSVDIGKIAFSKSSKLPRLIRYLIKGLGTIEEASEIVSYLLFEPAFCSQLIELGFEDGMREKDQILSVLVD